MKQHKINFMTLKAVLNLHNFLISEFGGADGIRDINLLESALAQPKAIFAKNYLHDNLFEMAAAYAYHIIKNHPFVDGNKRTGLFSAINFLSSNDIEIELTNTAFVKLAIDIASSKLTKTQIAALFKNCSKFK